MNSTVLTSLATRFHTLVFLAFFLQATLAVGQSENANETSDGDTGASSHEVQEQKRGPVTGHPLPRFVSLKASEGNARRGPSTSHRIDWVFQVSGMPLEVIAEHGHWRRVRFMDGSGGWMHYALLSGARTVVVAEDNVPLMMRPSDDSVVVAYAETGVVAKLGKCDPDWCRVTSGKHRGWVRKPQLWGVYPDEIR